jgi:ubiquinone/menaquinone biosynthesis C-methylase UbiE
MSFERPELDNPLWYAHMGEHIARYLFAVDYCIGRTVLDVGTGPGYGAYLLKASGASRVQAIDVDAPTIEKAASRYQSNGLSFTVSDAESLNGLEQPVQVVCSFENIEHLQSPKAFLAATAGILADDGLLICSTPDRRSTLPYVNGRPSNPYHIQEWYRDEFDMLLRSHFDIVEIRSQVETFAQNSRRNAMKSLCREFHYNPVFRLQRLLGLITGGRANSIRNLDMVQGLAAGSHHDYPIVEEAVAGVIGLPFCHVALCQRPRKN